MDGDPRGSSGQNCWGKCPFHPESSKGSLNLSETPSKGEPIYIWNGGILIGILDLGRGKVSTPIAAIEYSLELRILLEKQGAKRYLRRLQHHCAPRKPLLWTPAMRRAAQQPALRLGGPAGGGRPLVRGRLVVERRVAVAPRALPARLAGRVLRFFQHLLSVLNPQCRLCQLLHESTLSYNL